jgi:hypothetical protein
MAAQDDVQESVGPVGAVDGTPSSLVAELREGRAPPTIAAVAIAWALTLGPSGLGRGASVFGAILCLGALGAGVAGPLIARTRPRLGRHVGISLLAALATATWLCEAQSIHPLRLDPVRGVLGAIAWGVFALAWSERWSSHVTPVPVDPEAPVLLPRAALSPLATPLTWMGVAFAIGYLVLAFRVRDPERALVTQAVALACAVAVVLAAAMIATTRGKPRAPSARRLTPPVVRALLLLVTTAIAGAVITALR